MTEERFLSQQHVAQIVLNIHQEMCFLFSHNFISICKGTRHLFVAAERRIPRVVIETRQAASLEGQRIVISIDSWPQHSKYPVVSTLCVVIHDGRSVFSVGT